tara:strand:- start:4355 stop:4609 length:255 start_codon:yes stop_codon:yes gene_type:complete
MTHKNTYRVTYLEIVQKQVDIVADNQDEALQAFDMETFDPYRAVTINSVNKTLQDVQEMNFDIFREIDQANAYYNDYLKIGGSI